MKFVHINMTTGSVEEKPIPEEYAMLGGRGLTSIMINDLVPADCDPLGKDNLLIFAPGLLSGTPLVNTGRLSIGSKSPLTAGIKESNVGGTMAMALARHGIRSDHVLNLFSEVDGTLPGDKDAMTAPIKRFLQLSPEEQLVFCIGRRTHSLSSLADLDDAEKRFHAEQTCADLGANIENMDTIIGSIVKRFI